MDSLRAIGKPRRICFMLKEDANELLLTPYKNRDLKSHAVPAKVYTSDDEMDVSSQKLCRLLAGRHGWDITRSYRIPGVIHADLNVVVFSLRDAEIIEAANGRNNESDK